MRIIDETNHQIAMAVNIFEENVERLPRVAAVGDVIVLCCVEVFLIVTSVCRDMFVCCGFLVLS